MPPTEEDIIAAYRLTAAALYQHVSRRVGGDRALAEDVVQETYLRAIETWTRRGLPEQPLAWLHTVAGNLLASHFRRARPASAHAGAIDNWFARSQAEASTETASLIQWGLAQMRQDRARVLQAFYLDGASTRELAQQERATEKAIERRLARAREELRTRLQPHVQSNGDESIAGDA